MQRRGFLAMLAAGGLLACARRAPASPQSASRLVVLGSAGGPTPKPNRFPAAYALVVGDDVYLVDAGNGVAQQLARAGIGINRVRHVFVSHHHSDHDADIGTVTLATQSSVATTLFDLLGAQEQLAVQQENLSTAERTLLILRERMTVGTATGLDVAQQDTVVAQQLDAAGRGARQRRVQLAADRGHEPAQVHGVQAVRVLLRQDQRLCTGGIQMGGQRELHQQTMYGWVHIGFANLGFQLFLRGFFRHPYGSGEKSQTAASLLLVANIELTGRVFPHEDYA